MVWNAKVHTFHMVSLFGRTVIAKKMTFDPSTTLSLHDTMIVLVAWAGTWAVNWLLTASNILVSLSGR